MGVRRLWAALRWRRRLAALALAAAAAACGAALLRAPAAVSSRASFPRVHAAALAHLLADFSTYPLAGAWRVEEERGNYTDWSYRVAFECGARCAGAARVHAEVRRGGAAPRHGRAPAHRVTVQLTACTRPPLLPWPRLCDSLELESWVSARGAGCVLEERALARCGALRVLSGACARDLRALRDEHLARLRTALA